MDNRISRQYRKFRASGLEAARALDSARIVVRFDDLEAEGLVRLRAEPDEHYEWNEFDPQESEKYGADGAWGSIGEWRASEDDEWEQADSVWGHVGYRNVLDPHENMYVIDHMRACIDLVEAAQEQERYAGAVAGAD